MAYVSLAEKFPCKKGDRNSQVLFVYEGFTFTKHKKIRKVIVRGWKWIRLTSLTSVRMITARKLRKMSCKSSEF